MKTQKNCVTTTVTIVTPPIRYRGDDRRLVTDTDRRFSRSERVTLVMLEVLVELTDVLAANKHGARLTRRRMVGMDGVWDGRGERFPVKSDVNFDPFLSFI